MCSSDLFFFDGNLPRLVCELGSRIVNIFVVFQPKYSLGLIPMSGRAINHLQSHCFTFNLNQLNTTQHFESNPNFTASHRMSSSCTILPKARNTPFNEKGESVTREVYRNYFIHLMCYTFL